MIPRILNEIRDYLINCKLVLSSGSGDGRSDSANSEKIIISALQNVKNKSWSVLTPNTKNNRHWYDFICYDKDNNSYYCDIKISNLSGNDNMNAKKAIYWLLTGDENTHQVSDRNAVFFKTMKENENLSQERDFYYLVVNKNNVGDIFFVSLKNICEEGVNVSHNNPPIQSKWDKCRKIESRNMQQAKDFLLKKWAECIKKNIANLESGMPIHYQKYFKQ